ncbi:DUF2079 domain-containing protein [Catenulispora sp. NL8]|uniref:DUF2079 domain-containing protein n=1 Tax=Catenulispora pinistramenti TaxID=2705254 RepID=A0ABS5KQE8_9ACTN|nr:DUF2079 domain-containing protein [Catenulispora pinistramenti]MBS2548276.1 DUF2079 domain-containing protein [Catenulispora pinistramenti]
MGFLLAWCSLLTFWHYSEYGWDSEIFDQAIRNYAHFHLPRVPVLGTKSPTDPGYLQLRDHFSPILALLAPLYWFRDSPTNLYIAQAFLFMAAVPAVWLFTRRKLGVLPAYCVSLAFALAWPFQVAADFEFHEVAFAVPLTAWMIERFDAGRVRWGFAAAGALLLVKEDQGFVVAMYGLVMVLRGSRRLGAKLIAMGVGALAVLNVFILAPLNSTPGRQWMWTPLGKTAGPAAKFVVSHPITTLGDFLDPAHAKTQTLVLLFLPVLFLAFRSTLVLLALPLIGERFLSDQPNYWGLSYHYNAFLVPILFLAAVEGAQRLPRPRFSVPVWAVCCLAVTLALLPRFDLWQLKDSSFRVADLPQNSAISQALKVIPDGAVVDAYPPYGIRLTHRAKVVTAGSAGRYLPAWIIERDSPGFVAQNEKLGYKIRYRNAGIVVLQQVAGTPTTRP